MIAKKPAAYFDLLPKPAVETSPRWVRVKVGGETVASSTETLLLLQYGPRQLPTYFFPADAVNRALLTGQKEKGGKRYWDVRAGGERIPDAAWTYSEPPEELAALAGYVTFTWGHAALRWFEEATEVFAHARDPYKRVDALPSSRHVQILVGEQVIADSRRPILLFETHLPVRYYLPAEDVRQEFLRPSNTHSICPYKGQANYWSITAGDAILEDVVWSYAEPIPENPRIKGLMAFLQEKVTLIVDGQRQEKPLTPWS